METGNRVEVNETFAGAVDLEVNPGGPFQLIEVALAFDNIPTESENLTVKSINANDTELFEEVYDLSECTVKSYTYNADKRFPDGRKIQIDYANTDTNSITVIVVYQLDQSVV